MTRPRSFVWRGRRRHPTLPRGRYAIRAVRTPEKPTVAIDIDLHIRLGNVAEQRGIPLKHLLGEILSDLPRVRKPRTR